MDIATQLIGLVGAVSLIFAYYQVSMKIIETDSNRFQGLNFIGAICLVVSSFYFNAYGPAFLNLFWLIIAGSRLAALNRSSNLLRGKK